MRPTLQLRDDAHPNIFALGDISEIEGPKMGRTAMAQADLVGQNIVAMIQGAVLHDWEPQVIDGMLKLSLGLVSDRLLLLVGSPSTRMMPANNVRQKENNVAYVADGKGGDIMVPGKTKNLDLEVGGAWWYLGGSMKAELGG